ncbi:MAG TPA: AAA family ATPase [Propionibacteriaceae bacterium]|nr:AAA family ATPase [Propionibacteriaceae bacterium]
MSSTVRQVVFPPPREPDRGPDGGRVLYQLHPGGDFILDSPANPVPLWGRGDEVLLADGEALIIAGPNGVGKTSLAQQLVLGRAGFPEYQDLLGYPIAPGVGAVLYLAMDRPRQAARSFRRMVGEAWRDELNAKLFVWRGPPPYDLARHSSLLVDLCQQAGADTVVIDSLKDAAVGLSDDEVGARYNRCRQAAVAAGVQVIELHHNRKPASGVKVEKPSIEDLYGSTWLPSGAGSVLFLSGAPGDPIVGLHHLKQPAGEVGPLKIIHDQTSGRTTVWNAVSLLQLAGQPGGISAADAAKALFDVEKPNPAEKEKVRRKLEKLQRDGQLVVLEAGDSAAKKATRWGLR